MYGKMTKKNSKYFKDARKKLKQSKTMLQNISEETDIENIALICKQVSIILSNEIEKLENIDEYISDSNFVQLELNFN